MVMVMVMVMVIKINEQKKMYRLTIRTFFEKNFKMYWFFNNKYLHVGTENSQ